MEASDLCTTQKMPTMLLSLNCSTFLRNLRPYSDYVLVCLMTLIVMGLGLSLVDKRYPKRSMLMGLGLIIVLNLYWLVPFTLYVQSNTAALQDSLINRKITTLQVQNEQKYTVLSHTLRYAFSWIDDRLSTGDYAYLYHDWYNALPLLRFWDIFRLLVLLWGISP